MKNELWNLLSESCEGDQPKDKARLTSALPNWKKLLCAFMVGSITPSQLKNKFLRLIIIILQVFFEVASML